MKFLLFGMYGAVNVGDELVEYAVGSAILSAFPAAKFSVASSNPALSSRFNPLQNTTYFKGLGFSYRLWLYLFRTIRLFRQTDVVVVGGGGLFQDQYSWRLPSSAALSALWGLFFRKKVCIIGVGAGPLNRPWLQQMIGRTLSHVDLLCVRDQKAYDCLREIGIPEQKIEITADVVPSLQVNALLTDSSNNKNKEPKTVALILRDWQGISYSKVADLLTVLIQQGFAVQLHCFEPEPDSQFYDKILSHCSKTVKDSVTKIIPQTLKQVIQKSSEADFIISMRLHGCILAAALGIPFIPVEYESKVRSFTKQMGLTPLLAETKDLTPELAEQIQPAKRFWAEHKQEIDRQWEILRENSSRNFQRFTEVILLEPSHKSRRPFFLMLKLIMTAFVLEIAHLCAWPLKKISRKTT